LELRFKAEQVKGTGLQTELLAANKLIDVQKHQMGQLDRTIFQQKKKIAEHDGVTAALRKQLAQSLESFAKDVEDLQAVVEKERGAKEELAELVEEKDIKLKDVERAEASASEAIKEVTVEVTRMRDKMQRQSATLAREKELRTKYEEEHQKLTTSLTKAHKELSDMTYVS